jgi:hypothetical protein
MRLKLFPPLSLAVLLVFSAYPSFSQVAAAGVVKTIPLTVGVGVSSYSPDFKQGRLIGASLWLDYNPQFLPGRLHGLGLEAEGRDLNANQSSDQRFLREDVAAGGAIYSWDRFFAVHPYGKFLFGFGNADYPTATGAPHHQTRTVTIAGGGLEIRAYHRVWARADYEYQWWPDFYRVNTSNPGQLNPQGISVGVSYHFNQPAFR